MSVQFKADFDPTAGTVLPVPYLESKTDEVKLERGRQLFRAPAVIAAFCVRW